MVRLPAKRLGEIVLVVLLTPILLIFLAVSVTLLRISFRPLPPVPHFDVTYSVTNTTPVQNQSIYSFQHDLLAYRIRLRENGHIVQLSEDAQSRDEQARKAINADKSRQLKIDGKYGDGVRAVARNGNCLVKSGFEVQLWKNGKRRATIPQNVRGYSWKIFCDGNFHKLNGHDEVIGNISIATGCASSGGMSNPHSRYMPLLWRGSGLPEDLNSRIDKAGGWYLTKAIDINEHGQILCLALRADAKQAEDFNNIKNWQWVALTPLKNQ